MYLSSYCTHYVLVSLRLPGLARWLCSHILYFPFGKLLACSKCFLGLTCASDVIAILSTISTVLPATRRARIAVSSATISRTVSSTCHTHLFFTSDLPVSLA